MLSYFSIRSLPRARVRIAVLLFGVFATLAYSLQRENHSQALVTIAGTVHDKDGEAVAGAEVRLTSKNLAETLRTKSDAAGHFVFTALTAGAYQLTAAKDGAVSQPVGVDASSAGDNLHADLVIAHEPRSSRATSASQMEFYDQPSFTIAGVTDWTAAGGHGSDSILRTSESLTRETLALRPDAISSATASSGRAVPGEEERLRAVLAAAPGSFKANAGLGKFYADHGNYPAAIPLFQKAYEIDKDNRENAYELAEAYKATGDFAKARSLIAALKATHETGDIDRLSAEVDEQSGNPTAAAEEFQRAVRLDPSERNYFELGSELLLHRAIWQAKQVFEEGVKAYSASARMQAALGTALFAGALYDDAARQFCKASDLSPDDPEPYLFMGKIEIASPGPLPCVEEKLARFAGRNPENALANYFYAMAIWKQSGNAFVGTALEHVNTLLNQAVAIDPKCSDALLQLGNLDALRGDYPAAIGLYHKAIEANPRLNEAHYRLGVAYDRVGDKERARQEFQLHETLEKEQAAEVDRQRREIKQFVVETPSPAPPSPNR